MIEKVEVNLTHCIGCGTCWVALPQVFRETPEYKAEVTGGLADGALLRRAAQECPSLAISLHGPGGVLIYPTEEAIGARACADWA
jgi:ferredoxin